MIDNMSKQKEQISKACSNANHAKCNSEPYIICDCECHKRDEQKERRFKSAYSAMSNASVSSWNNSLPITGF